MLRSHANGLDGKLATAHVEKVLEVGTQKVNDEDVVETFLPKIMDLGNTGYVHTEQKGQRA